MITKPAYPESWEIVKLQEIASSIKGKKPKKLGDKSNKFSIPYIDIKAFEKKIFRKFTDGENTRLCEKSDVLIVWDGARSGLVGTDVKGAIGSTLAKINNFGLNSKYLFYILRSKFNYINSNPRGVGIPHVDPNLFWSIRIPVAPMNEQTRIVGRVEELFSRLDAGVRSLQAAQTQLEQYRQTTLNQAYTGKLTQKWRKNSTENLFSSNKLLEKIEEHRIQNGIKKPRKLPKLNTSELIQIPDNWVWVQINDVASELQYGTSKKADYYETGIPVLRMGNIQDGKLDYNDLKYFDPNSPEIHKFLLTEGDILFNRTNSAELVGKTAIYHDSYPDSIFASYLIRVKTLKKFIIPEIIFEFINSVIGKNYIANVRSQQVGQANVNGTKLAAMPIPLIPYNEQEKILEILDTINSNLFNIQNEIEISTKQADFLKQSILKKAFEGKLGPQDPRDEPASVLLDRIKAQNVKQRKLI